MTNDLYNSPNISQSHELIEKFSFCLTWKVFEISYKSICMFPLMLRARSLFNGVTVICSNFTNLL